MDIARVCLYFVISLLLIIGGIYIASAGILYPSIITGDACVGYAVLGLVTILLGIFGTKYMIEDLL